MQKKSIIIVRDGLKRGGGGCTILLWLAKKLSLFYDVSFLLLYKELTEESILKDYNYELLNIHFYDSRFKRKLQLYFTGTSKITSYIKKANPDLVISFGMTSIVPVTIAKCILGFRYLVSERSDPYSFTSFSDKVRFFCYNFADIVVFQIPGAAKFFNKRINKRAVVIPNPIDIRSKQWTHNGNFKIANVARFELKQKRQDVLVKAFSIVHHEIPSSSLHFFGDGDDIDIVKALVAEIGLSEHVVFHGVVKNVCEQLYDFDCFVLSSDYEGMPNALMEAQSIGIPVVSTDCRPGGASYLLCDGEYGRLVEKANEKALADAITEALINPEEASKKAQMGRSFLEKNLSEDSISNHWHLLIERMLEQK